MNKLTDKIDWLEVNKCTTLAKKLAFVVCNVTQIQHCLWTINDECKPQNGINVRLLRTQDSVGYI